MKFQDIYSCNTHHYIVFSIIGIYRLIILPFKMINESFNIWNRIKNLKIKKRK